MFIKITIFMFVITLYSQNINAQTGWFTQSSGTNNLLWSIDFIDINTGFAVGEMGTVLKTTNGGNNWFRINISLSNTLTCVSFIDHNTGWISAHGGLILKTTNGGNQWISQNSGTFGNLFFVTFKNPSIGWIPSDIGVLHTTNGGTNWTIQFNSNVGIYSVYFFNRLNGWFEERFGNMYKTTNGGNNWIFTENVINTATISFYFINQNTGWGVGYENAILKTTNGGNNWFRQISAVSGTQQLRSVTFIDTMGQVGWIVGFNNTFMKTRNGGTNWVQQTVPVNTYYTSIKFITPLTGWAVGGNGTIIKTITGGLTSIKPVSNEIPSHFILYQNFPNPFNPSTKINYSLPNTQYIILKVFNALGKEITALVNEKQNAGNYSIEFDASNLSSGIYFYTLKADNFKETKRMLLLK